MDRDIPVIVRWIDEVDRYVAFAGVAAQTKARGRSREEALSRLTEAVERESRAEPPGGLEFAPMSAEEAGQYTRYVCNLVR